MTTLRSRALFTLATCALLLAVPVTHAAATPDGVRAGASVNVLPAGGPPDAGPDAAAVDADLDSLPDPTDAEINDPALDRGDCRVAPGGRSGASHTALLVLVGMLFIAQRRRK